MWKFAILRPLLGRNKRQTPILVATQVVPPTKPRMSARLEVKLIRAQKKATAAKTISSPVPTPTNAPPTDEECDSCDDLSVR